MATTLGGLTFWGSFWATFAGGLAAALVSIVGIVIVEVLRGRQEQQREARRVKAARMQRRRTSRNAAQSVFMELSVVARPLLVLVAGNEGWEPLRVVRTAWDDQSNRAALNDALTLEALLDVERAYRELGAIENRLRDGHVHGASGAAVVFSPFFDQLRNDDAALARRIIAVHIQPGIDRLNEAIALLETLELAEEGKLEAEAARIRDEAPLKDP